MPSGIDQKRAPMLEPVLKGRTKAKYIAVVALWAGLAIFFWSWWLQGEHVIGWGRYVLVTACLFWIFFLQAYFIAMFLRACQASRDAVLSPELRVAMIVTKAPAEPFSVVQRTLEAMLAQEGAHDTWLADEDPQPDTIAWCKAHNVQISSRKGVADYHRDVWPRRTRCKEGNLAYFYDHFGYERYDIVAQFDADHVPQPGYLKEILRPFADPQVGYVSAPSICAANADESWAARTRLHAEAMFHGVLQAGYNNGWAPMCIGSHYAVRTAALKQIGGLGPELAEDHSTSMLMNAGGWKGMHAMDAIAIGQGPASFADLITQEFQWSRSLVTLLLSHTPRYLASLSPLRVFQFVFSQMWYPLFALFMACMYVMPILALLFDMRFVGVTYLGFLGHILPALCVLVLLAFLIRADGFFRPYDAKVLGWEKAFFAALQWPWVLRGSLTALMDKITGKFVDFRVTPKGEANVEALPWPVLLPYVALAAGALAPVLFVPNVDDAPGFYLFALFNAAIYSGLLLLIITNHLRQNAELWSVSPIQSVGQYSTAAVLGVCVALGTVARGGDAVVALAATHTEVQLVQHGFVVAGAGQGAYSDVKAVYNNRWLSELFENLTGKE